jgi:protein SCO1
MSIKMMLASVMAMGAIASAAWYAEGAFGEAPPGPERFPNIELTTQDGRKVRLVDDLIKGKAVAVNTFFASCSEVCPLGTAKMLELQRLLGDRVGKDIFFYSLSVDPLRDTPAAMKAYAERYGVGPGWLFLTGKEEDIRRAVRALGLGTLAAGGTNEDHSTTLMVGHEPSGRWMKNSATDNPRFTAASMQTFLGWPAEGIGAQRYEQAAPISMSNGEFLFRNGCAACHSIGGGDRIGPDLLGVTARRDRAWVERFIQAPDRMLAAGDPQAVQLNERFRGVQMPNLDLTRDDVADIVDHLETATRARSPAQGP